jgi:hypothetical protein
VWNRKLLPNEGGQWRAIPAANTVEAGAERDEHAMTSDDRTLALSLITTWATRTGRVLRPVPVSELSAEELVNFWADDQLEDPLDTPVRDRSR